MLFSKKTIYFLIGLILIHSVIFFSIYDENVPSLIAIPWKHGESFLFPFAISRYFDFLLIPAVFIFFGLLNKLDWWQSDSWGKRDYPNEWTEGLAFGNFFAIITGLGIAIAYLSDCDCSSEPFFDTLSALLKIATVIGLVFWTTVVLIGDVATATYIVCLMFFTIGTTIALIAGFPYFLLLSVPSALIALSIPVFQSPQTKQFVLELKLKLKKWWAERNETKRIIKTALNLKVTPKTKEKILSIVKEIPLLEKEIKRLREHADEIKRSLSEIVSQLDTALKSAKKKDIDERIAEACQKVSESLQAQKEAFSTLLAESRSVIAEKELRMKELLHLLERAKKEAEFCDEYDILAKTTLEIQKRVKKVLKEISSELLK